MVPAQWLFYFVLQVEQNSASSVDARGKAKSYLGQLLKKDMVLYIHFLRPVCCRRYRWPCSELRKGGDSRRSPLDPADDRESAEEILNQVCCLYNTQFSKPISSFM